VSGPVAAGPLTVPLLASLSVAKKSRTPPPPRRPVQAPQRRSQRSDAAGTLDSRKMRGLMLFAAAGLVGLVAVILVIVLTSRNGGKSTDASVASAMRAAGCTYQDVTIPTPPGKIMHIPTMETKVTWQTYPPAGGRHFGQWAFWRFYRDPVPPKMVVHNEEHGGVVLWWGQNTPASVIDELEAFYNSSDNSMLGTPAEPIDGKSLGSKVAITAWTGDPTKYGRSGYYGFGHAAVCPTFNESAFKTFRDAYRGKGPEGIPTSLNNPGEGP
jgi:hypothetical protein